MSVSQAQQIKGPLSRRIEQKVVPVYPELARKMRLTGKVRIIATVAPSGKVVSIQVVGGHPVLARAAADAVMQWRYEPTLQGTNEIAIVSFDP